MKWVPSIHSSCKQTPIVQHPLLQYIQLTHICQQDIFVLYGEKRNVKQEFYAPGLRPRIFNGTGVYAVVRHLCRRTEVERGILIRLDCYRLLQKRRRAAEDRAGKHGKRRTNCESCGQKKRHSRLELFCHFYYSFTKSTSIY